MKSSSAKKNMSPYTRALEVLNDVSQVWGGSLIVSHLKEGSFGTGGKANYHDVFPSLKPMPSTGTIVSQVPSRAEFRDRVLSVRPQDSVEQRSGGGKCAGQSQSPTCPPTGLKWSDWDGPVLWTKPIIVRSRISSKRTKSRRPPTHCTSARWLGWSKWTSVHARLPDAGHDQLATGLPKPNAFSEASTSFSAGSALRSLN